MRWARGFRSCGQRKRGWWPREVGHRREPAFIDNQTVIRLNRDTLYSFGVFDLADGRVTVTLPDAGRRFMSLMVINEGHYVLFGAYDSKPHEIT
jgi:hypothetical protein